MKDYRRREDRLYLARRRTGLVRRLAFYTIFHLGLFAFFYHYWSVATS